MSSCGMSWRMGAPGRQQDEGEDYEEQVKIMKDYI